MRNLKTDILILKEIQKANIPVGASYISQQLNIAPATVGRVLTDLEEKHLLMKISNKGRVLTEAGTAYLNKEKSKEEKEKIAEHLVNFVSEADKTTLLEVLQVRKLLEVQAIKLACVNATDDEIQNLEELMLEHLREIRAGSLGSNTDFRIHMAIARASKQRTIYQILKLILTDDNVYTKFSYVSDQLIHAQIKQHDKIVEAIRARNPEQAAAAMEDHLDQIIKDVEAYFD